jgi:hypothetical protein
MLNEEKSKSKSQQRLMGMVYAYEKGDLKIDGLPQSLADKIKGIANGTKRKTGDKRKKTKGISMNKAKDFASTKHKGLPENVKENLTIIKFEEFLNEKKDSKDKNEENKIDVIIMDVPLYIRMLEYAREDAKTDMDLHITTENILNLLKTNKVLTMDNYNDIVYCKENKKKK